MPKPPTAAQQARLYHRQSVALTHAIKPDHPLTDPLAKTWTRGIPQDDGTTTEAHYPTRGQQRAAKKLMEALHALRVACDATTPCESVDKFTNLPTLTTKHLNPHTLNLLRSVLHKPYTQIMALLKNLQADAPPPLPNQTPATWRATQVPPMVSSLNPTLSNLLENGTTEQHLLLVLALLNSAATDCLNYNPTKIPALQRIHTLVANALLQLQPSWTARLPRFTTKQLNVHTLPPIPLKYLPPTHPDKPSPVQQRRAERVKWHKDNALKVREIETSTAYLKEWSKNQTVAG